jgi:hypothetical protein
VDTADKVLESLNIILMKKYKIPFTGFLPGGQQRPDCGPTTPPGLISAQLASKNRFSQTKICREAAELSLRSDQVPWAVQEWVGEGGRGARRPQPQQG